MVTRRTPIPRTVREEVTREWGRACWLRFPGCTESREITMDHLYPHRLGGGDTARNLRPACRHCNSARQDRLVQGRGLMVTIHMLSPYERWRPDAWSGRVLDWRDLLDVVRGRGDDSWTLMEGLWRGGLFDALRTPSTSPLMLVPPPDTPGTLQREWIRLGYRLEYGRDVEAMRDPSCELEARAWTSWARWRLGAERVGRLDAERERDWAHYGLVF